MEQSKYIIGFANDYYTLWEITKTGPIYIKNISKDIENVKQQYPGIEINIELKGYRYFNDSEKEELPEGTFKFGKYKGQGFIDHHDIDYLLWYSEQIGNESNDFQIIKEELEKYGYHYINYKWINEEKYNEYLEEQKIKENLKQLFSECKPFTVFCKTNCDDEGIIEIGYNYKAKFPNIKENNYNGWFYYLPVVNGKCKRIKNKCLLIEKYTFDSKSNIVNIIDFQILKDNIEFEEL